jgi:hypothetical protein
MSASNTLTTVKSSTLFDPVQTGREIDELWKVYSTQTKCIEAAQQTADDYKEELIQVLRHAHDHVADFSAFIKEHTKIGRSTAYRLLAITDGRGEEVRQRERYRKRKSRAASVTPPVTDTAPAPEAPLKPFATLKREVDAQWRAQLPENRPQPDPRRLDMTNEEFEARCGVRFNKAGADEKSRLLQRARDTVHVADSFFDDDERTTLTVSADADTIEVVKAARDAWDWLYRGLCAEQKKTNVIPLKKKDA